MKKQIILGSFLAFAGILSAQAPDWAGAANTTGGIYRSGLVGLGSGMTSPLDNLHILANSGIINSGITIDQYTQNNGGACLKLRYTGDANGREYILGSSGSNNPQGSGNFFLYDTPSNSYRMFVHGPTGNVGIGTSNPMAKLNAVITINGSAIRGDASNISGGNVSAVVGNANSTFTGSGDIVGVRGGANSGLRNYGGYFIGSTGAAGTVAYGVFGEIPSTNPGGLAYAVYGQAWAAATAGAGPRYAGYFNGDVVTTSPAYYISDKKMKKNIVPINHSLDLISKLNPVTYNFDIESNAGVSLPAEKQYGFISQEIKEVLPEFTKTIVHPSTVDQEGKEIYPSKEILGLNYNGFIALLTKGMQEQQSQIESLSATVKKQNEMINALINKTGTSTGINENNTVPAGFNMEQNIPNPFNNETVIEYTVPTMVANASLVVYDLSGKQIASFPITEKGSSSITITSEKLAAGIYIYSVMADGKIIDSKRMVVANK